MAVLLLLALSLAMLAAAVTGAVDWTDDVADPQGDVRDSFGNITRDKEGVDILGVDAIEDGTDLNVTLSLAGPYQQGAEYRVDLLADGSAGYRLTWSAGAFSAKGPTGAAIAVSGTTSRNGAALTWTAARSAFSVVSSLRIGGAGARLAVPGALVYTDTAMGAPSGAVQLPKRVEVLVVYEALNLRNVTVTVTYEGANASAVRSAMDRDADGTVTAAEAAAYADGVRQRIARDSMETLGMMGGRNATRVSYGFEVQGAEGAASGTGPVRFVMTQSLEFPQQATEGVVVHRFHQESAIGGDEPWDKKAVGDDPWGDECIGGDEPWDNVFFGGVLPWEAQAIGGDEPWDNKADVAFKLVAPEGWRFATGGWPAGMTAYLSSDGTVLEMGTAGASSDYAATMGKLNSVSFEKVVEHANEDGGFIPGPGAAIAMASAVLAALAMRVGGRRASPD